LTQYKPLSLMEHIGNGEPWDFIGRLRGAKILPPRTGEKDSDWYKGTADAIRQNLDYVKNFKSKQVLILSGDHVYHMDYSKMIAFHRNHGADLTIAMMSVSRDQIHHFGIGIVDNHNRLLKWEEKPHQSSSDLASMGIYVFNTDFLFDCLHTIPEHDFGKHIIPHVLATHKVYAYPFSGYWRDVGTLFAYWNTNMDLIRPGSGLDISRWKLYTNTEEEGRAGDRQPTRILSGSRVTDSIISQGCIIEGEVTRSVLSPGVRVGKDATVSDSVIMHDSIIEAGASLRLVIADKQTHFGRECTVGFGDRTVPNHRFPDHLKEGLTVVGKNAVVPAKARIGTNCFINPEVTETCFANEVVADGETIAVT